MVVTVSGSSAESEKKVSPVSYTHLDVYKRQLKQRFPEQSVFFRGIHRFLASDGADMVMEMADEDLGVSGNAMPAMDNEESKSAAAQTPDYSGTNLQVQGVDEADILKTDGRYIYHVNGQRIVVATAYPPEEMEITDIIDFEKDFYPCEMYLDERFLVVIGAACNEIPVSYTHLDVYKRQSCTPPYLLTYFISCIHVHHHGDHSSYLWSVVLRI